MPTWLSSSFRTQRSTFINYHYRAYPGQRIIITTNYNAAKGGEPPVISMALHDRPEGCDGRQTNLRRIQQP